MRSFFHRAHIDHFRDYTFLDDFTNSCCEYCKDYLYYQEGWITLRQVKTYVHKRICELVQLLGFFNIIYRPFSDLSKSKNAEMVKRQGDDGFAFLTQYGSSKGLPHKQRIYVLNYALRILKQKGYPPTEVVTEKTDETLIAIMQLEKKKNKDCKFVVLSRDKDYKLDGIRTVNRICTDPSDRGQCFYSDKKKEETKIGDLLDSKENFEFRILNGEEELSTLEEQFAEVQKIEYKRLFLKALMKTESELDVSVGIEKAVETLFKVQKRQNCERNLLKLLKK